MRSYKTGTARWGGTILIASAGVALVTALAACSSSKHEAAARPVPSAHLTISPAAGMHNVAPDAGVMVTAAHGRVSQVIVRASGGPVAGQLTNGGTVWRSEQTLNPSRSYTVTAIAVGQNGKKITANSSFTTLTPHRTFHATLLEGTGQTYGVGMPIVFTFSRPIRYRAAVERSLSLTTSRPVTGAWYWDGNQTVEFRPKVYWKPGTQISVTAHFSGVEGAKGVYGTSDVQSHFVIGPSLIAMENTRTHYMHVYYKGKLLGDWPTSSGRPGDDSWDGHYLTIEKGNPTYMKGPGYGLWVYWAVRYTWSGDYIHSAPWSVWAQGSVNVSHGCINTSPAHAEEFYKLAVPGDPVIVTGSPAAGYWDNGWTEWFLNWHQLVRGSALHEAVTAGPNGSTFVSAQPTHSQPLSQYMRAGM